MRLSGAMTRKFAVAGLPFGGGKAVIAVPELPSGAPRRELFLRYGELVDSLGGTFRTSLDMNTGVPDLDVIGERTEYVFGKSVEAGGSGSPAPPTAMGVLYGIRASLGHAFGSDDPAGRTVAIQGAGGVGDPLADTWRTPGRQCSSADIDPARAGRSPSGWAGPRRRGRGARAECDVFAPCAVGGMLNDETIPRLRCRIVAGSANNQLADPGRRRPPARARDPLRARLRHQRRWSHRDRRPRAARLESGRARRGARANRRDVVGEFREGRGTGDLDRGSRRGARRRAAQRRLARVRRDGSLAQLSQRTGGSRPPRASGQSS